VTGNYQGITVVPATLIVTPVTLTIAANNTGKIYGAIDPALTAVVSGMVAGETFTGSYNVSRAPGENAGSYVIAVNNAVFDNPNYTVTVVSGTFVITAADAVSVIVSGATKPYDGTPLVPSANTAIGLRAGDTIAHLDYTGTLTDVGTTAASAENIKINDAAGNDVTGNYQGITVVPATLIVTPASATITVADATKVAGAADPAFAGVVAGLVKSGDLGAITYSRTNTDVNAPGVYTGVLTAVYTANKNYTVTVVSGTFVITAAPVVPATPDPTPPKTPPIPTSETPPTSTPETPPTSTPETPPTPGTPPANDLLAPIVTPIVEVLQDVAEAVIGDSASPLAPEQSREAEIGDNETPLADHAWCWVHWYILLGIAVTFVYSACTILHRGLFSRRLKKYEDDITGGGDPAFGGAVASGSRPSMTSMAQNASATTPAASALDE
ncbi:MAG: MBG domain-containing protein, partial [Raoultibacter sp.]